MGEDTLFDAPQETGPTSAFTGKQVARARTTDPQTSHDAAATVNVTKSKALVLRAARLHAGTADELRETILRAGQTISPSGCRTRAKELCDDGLMYVVNHIGGHAVYALTDRGRTVAIHLAAQANPGKRKQAA